LLKQKTEDCFYMRLKPQSLLFFTVILSVRLCGRTQFAPTVAEQNYSLPCVRGGGSALPTRRGCLINCNPFVILNISEEFSKAPSLRKLTEGCKRYAAKAAVTFVTRNKSNQKYFLCYRHSATADRLNSARLIGTQMCIPITVTAIKINQILQALSAAYGHSLRCFFGHNTVSLLRSGSQHFSFLWVIVLCSAILSHFVTAPLKRSY